MIIAGIDEAGYGPLLGPLVVSCAALDVPGDFGVFQDKIDGLPCFWNILKAAVAAKPAAAKGRVLVADSKVVHHLSDGDSLLERAVLAFAAAAGLPAATLMKLLPELACPDHGLDNHPWYAHSDTPLPRWTDPGDLAIATNVLKNTMQRTGVRVRAMRTAVIPEGRFNTLVGGTQNKASALISITIRHLYCLHSTFGGEGLVVAIDKQGGRDHYTRLLLDSFPEAQLKVLCEAAESSSYLLTEPGATPRRTLVLFREKSERYFLSTALASMVCKYLRESLMAQFNDWWCQQVPGLRPTAGYYQDGQRWLTDVEPHLRRLKVRATDLVRIR